MRNWSSFKPAHKYSLVTLAFLISAGTIWGLVSSPNNWHLPNSRTLNDTIENVDYEWDVLQETTAGQQWIYDAKICDGLSLDCDFDVVNVRFESTWDGNTRITGQVHNVSGWIWILPVVFRVTFYTQYGFVISTNEIVVPEGEFGDDYWYCDDVYFFEIEVNEPSYRLINGVYSFEFIKARGRK